VQNWCLLLLVVVVVMVVTVLMSSTLLHMLWHGVVEMPPFRVQVTSMAWFTFFTVYGTIHRPRGHWAGAVAAGPRPL
jgi:hypothetical protein